MSQVGIATSELGSRVPRKAKAILDRLVGSRAMTQEGMEWLICATDPFHDDRVRCPGYPDMSTVNSVVQTFTNTVSYQAPNGQTTPWDLHVGFLPASTPMGTGAGSSTGKPYFQPWVSTYGGTLSAIRTGVPKLYPGYNAIVEPTSGASWYLSGDAINDGALAIPAKYCSGHYRLIGGGIEAVNTTADLYKGGSLTAYRSPSDQQDAVVTQAVSVGGTTLTTNTQTTGIANRNIVRRDSQKELEKDDANVVLVMAYPIRAINQFPATQSEASLFTDSRTWAAEDGCYSILNQSDLENPFLSLTGGEVLVNYANASSTFQQQQALGATGTVWTSTWYDGYPVFNNYGSSACQTFPFSQCGFVMAGLNPNSTIQLTQRLYFERIPSTAEPDLLSMCQVPPAHDAVAMEIYSRCLGQMPVAVPVSENPLGEWFNSILDTIKSVAPKLGNIVTGVGNAIASIGGNPKVQPVQSNATPQRKQNAAQKKQFKNNAKRGPSGNGPKRTGQKTSAKSGPKRRPPTRKS